MEGKNWTTPRYRAVAYGSTVDETLFGSPGSGRGGAGQHNLSKSVRKIVTGPIAPSAVVISSSELDRIKQESVIKTEAELAADREQARLIKEEKEKLSKARKEKMRQLEKKAMMMSKKSDFEIAEMAKTQTIRALAAEQIDNNSDVVKLLNSMAQRATAFTIRDKQLEEKKRLEKVEEEFEKRLDIITEIDRIKEIQRREEEEKSKRIKRVEDRKVINVQIEQRSRTKLLSMEAREQENKAMRDLMKKYEEEDRVNAEKKQVEIEQSRLEVIQANESAIRRKREAREREKKEVEDILIYQALKDAELAKREAEELEKEKTKKELQAKLLAEQEKVQSNAGKLDELRARRAAEEKERLERKKERDEALKKRSEIKDLLDSRAKQAADKAARLQVQKKQAEVEILHGLEYTRKMDERESMEQRLKKERSELHREKLQSQIVEYEHIRKERDELERGGQNIHQDIVREEAKLKVIRDKMVADLISQGVNERYLSEMRNVDIGKILKR